MREHLPDERTGIAHHTKIFDGQDWLPLHVNVGLYEDGRPGELFVKLGKPGEVVAAIDQWAIAMSVALQLGADLEGLLRKFVGTRFEPCGATTNEKIPRCSSPCDYVARWMLGKFCPEPTAVEGMS